MDAPREAEGWWLRPGMDSSGRWITASFLENFDVYNDDADARNYAYTLMNANELLRDFKRVSGFSF
jgi:hypothetical protein